MPFELKEETNISICQKCVNAFKHFKTKENFFFVARGHKIDVWCMIYYQHINHGFYMWDMAH